MTWSPALNLKSKAQKLEDRMIVKMIIERIIKILLKNKIIYSFELICSHHLVSGITSFSMILLMRPECLIVAGITKCLVLTKCFCFYQEICFSFSSNRACTFWKDVNDIITGKDNHPLKSSSSHLNYQGQCLAGLKYSWLWWNFLPYLLNIIFSLSCRGKWKWYYSILPGRSPNTE